MILAQDEEVFSELCRNLSEEQKAAFVQMADAILDSIDEE